MMTADGQDIELDMKMFTPAYMASQGEEHPPLPINFKIHITMDQEQMNPRSWRRKINSS